MSSIIPARQVLAAKSVLTGWSIFGFAAPVLKLSAWKKTETEPSV